MRVRVACASQENMMGLAVGNVQVWARCGKMNGGFHGARRWAGWRCWIRGKWQDVGGWGLCRVGKVLR